MWGWVGVGELGNAKALWYHLRLFTTSYVCVGGGAQTG